MAASMMNLTSLSHHFLLGGELSGIITLRQTKDRLDGSKQSVESRATSCKQLVLCTLCTLLRDALVCPRPAILAFFLAAKSLRHKTMEGSGGGGALITQGVFAPDGNKLSHDNA